MACTSGRLVPANLELVLFKISPAVFLRPDATVTGAWKNERRVYLCQHVTSNVLRRMRQTPFLTCIPIYVSEDNNSCLGVIGQTDPLWQALIYAKLFTATEQAWQ